MGKSMIIFKRRVIFMRRFSISLILVALPLTLGVLCLAQQVIQWDKADKYYGKNVTVEGTIVATYNSGQACFLNFHQNCQRYFTAVIFESDFPKFPPNPETYFKGKKVHVQGVVKEYRGKPEIIIKDAIQIQIVE